MKESSNKKRKIAILDAKTLGDSDLSVFENFGELNIYQTTPANKRIDHIGQSEIVITNKVVIDREIMSACKNLKLICISATGMNNVDLDAAKELKIEVKNVAGYSTPSVVQLTFSHLFFLLGHLKYYDNYTKNKEWTKSDIFTNMDKNFHEICGKRWGIIGLGSIGREVAKVATAFGAEVCYYSTSGVERKEELKRVELKKLLETSDIVSIHAPLNEKTKNLLNYEKLSQLKDGVILLNLGRGGIINEGDLAKVVDEKEMYVGLDVLSVEPMEEDNPLNFIKNRDRVFITPHIAWGSVESRERLIDGIVQNINGFINS